MTTVERVQREVDLLMNLHSYDRNNCLEIFLKDLRKIEGILNLTWKVGGKARNLESYYDPRTVKKDLNIVMSNPNSLVVC